MQPKSSAEEADQGELFRSRLDQILDHQHPLFQLAREVEWGFFAKRFGIFFDENIGRPALPTRLIVGLHYLKYTFSESDESVVDRLLENPYWQYFCGFEYFEHERPCDPSSLVHWRQRVGSDGIEELLRETVALAKRKKFLKKSDVAKVNVDTTVQEKNITFPTDSKLYHRMRIKLVKLAKRYGILLRQSYERLGKKAFHRQGRYRHAQQMKRAGREVKKLRNYLGRVIRDIRRQAQNPDFLLSEMLELGERIYNQKREDKKKVYSIYAPEVECICKGKDHKKYEFGCKASVVSTSKNNWVIGAKAHHENPYDGHTLKESLDQSERFTGWRAKEAHVDRGYRGALGVSEEVTIHVAGKRRKNLSRSLQRWMKRRSAIEPMIGHLKSDNRLSRNYLKGKLGDEINVLLAGCGYNMRKLFWAFSLSFFGWLFPVSLQPVRSQEG
jgi:IS5 family transposase